MFKFQFLKFVNIDGIKVKSQNSIVEIQNLSEMSVNNECLVILSEVTHSSNFNLDHLEFLSGSCSAYVNIEVSVFNIKNNEFCQSISSAKSSKLILPVSNLINLIGLHCEDIYDMNEGRDFINKN